MIHSIYQSSLAVKIGEAFADNAVFKAMCDLEPGPNVPVYPHEDHDAEWYIFTARDVEKERVGVYEIVFGHNLGEPHKRYTEPLIIDETVPSVFFPYLNRMHGHLLGGQLVNSGELSNEEIVIRIGMERYGDAIVTPFVNLFPNQQFYGRIDPDEPVVEIGRISPHMFDADARPLAHDHPKTYTVEYMHYRELGPPVTPMRSVLPLRHRRPREGGGKILGIKDVSSTSGE